MKTQFTNEPKVWFKFYTPSLLEHWNSRKEGRSKEKLFEILAKLHTKGCKKNTVAQYFHRTKTLPKEVLNGVWLLLTETKFYNKLFEIGMTPRRELHNSKPITEGYYELLKNQIAKEDEFFGRWIELYELNYQTEILTREEKELRYEQIFQEYKSEVVEKTFFQRERKLLKQIDKEIWESIEKHYEILNLFYKVCLGLAYFGFLRNLKNYKSIEKYSSRILSIRNFVKDNLFKLKSKLEAFGLYEKFYTDFRIHEIYFYGNEILGIEITPFRYESPQKRENMLTQQKETLNLCKPTVQDSIQYRVWYKYFEFMHLQWEAIHNLEKVDLLSGIENLKSCLGYLEEFEKELAGFVRILFKVKYHKRNLNFLISSLEIYLLEQNFHLNQVEQSEIQARHLLEIEKWMRE